VKSWSLAAVIECKSPPAKPWAALMVSDKVNGFAAVMSRSISADEESWHRLMNAWGGSPFRDASSADALVSVHEDQKSDYNTAGSALRQVMSAVSGIDETCGTPPNAAASRVISINARFGCRARGLIREHPGTRLPWLLKLEQRPITTRFAGGWSSMTAHRPSSAALARRTH